MPGTLRTPAAGTVGGEIVLGDVGMGGGAICATGAGLGGGPIGVTGAGITGGGINVAGAGVGAGMGTGAGARAGVGAGSDCCGITGSPALRTRIGGRATDITGAGWAGGERVFETTGTEIDGAGIDTGASTCAIDITVGATTTVGFAMGIGIGALSAGSWAVVSHSHSIGSASALSLPATLALNSVCVFAVTLKLVDRSHFKKSFPLPFPLTFPHAALQLADRRSRLACSHGPAGDVGCNGTVSAGAAGAAGGGGEGGGDCGATGSAETARIRTSSRCIAISL